MLKETRERYLVLAISVLVTVKETLIQCKGKKQHFSVCTIKILQLLFHTHAERVPVYITAE